MRSTRRAWLAAIAATGSLAGCVDGDDEDDGDGGTGGDGTSDGGMDGELAVEVSEHGTYGEILVDPDGSVLYMFDSDEQDAGESTCYDGCEGNWPALTVDGDPAAGDGVDAELTTFEREGGSMQVAADGWPLYYFAGDESAGDANGQGIGGVWWVLRPDGTPVRADVAVAEHDEHGEILVDGDGMTLYQFDSDEQGSGASTCYDGCASNWPPLTVEDDPIPTAAVGVELTTFEREDGSMQVAADGWPLYYFGGDGSAGDANGQGLNGVWWVMAPDGTIRRENGGS